MPDRYSEPTELDDDDYDPYPPHYHAARPPHRSPGAVIETYVDTDALEVPCPACDAALGDFCHHPDGTERKMPCPRRITAALKGGR